jgi:hypothetical protein
MYENHTRDDGEMEAAVKYTIRAMPCMLRLRMLLYYCMLLRGTGGEDMSLWYVDVQHL